MAWCLVKHRDNFAFAFYNAVLQFVFESSLKAAIPQRIRHSNSQAVCIEHCQLPPETSLMSVMVPCVARNTSKRLQQNPASRYRSVESNRRTKTNFWLKVKVK
jgi:hypothetical protein